VFRDKNLIILIEWVGSAEILFIEFDSLLSDHKHKLVVHILYQRLSCVDPHVWGALVILFEVRVVSSHNSIEVSRYFVRLFENADAWFLDLRQVSPEVISNIIDGVSDELLVLLLLVWVVVFIGNDGPVALYN
jgi:hypothetical protein